MANFENRYAFWDGVPNVVNGTLDAGISRKEFLSRDPMPSVSNEPAHAAVPVVGGSGKLIVDKPPRVRIVAVDESFVPVRQLLSIDLRLRLVAEASLLLRIYTAEGVLVFQERFSRADLERMPPADPREDGKKGKTPLLNKLAAASGKKAGAGATRTARVYKVKAWIAPTATAFDACTEATTDQTIGELPDVIAWDRRPAHEDPEDFEKKHGDKLGRNLTAVKGPADWQMLVTNPRVIHPYGSKLEFTFRWEPSFLQVSSTAPDGAVRGASFRWTVDGAEVAVGTALAAWKVASEHVIDDVLEIEFTPPPGAPSRRRSYVVRAETNTHESAEITVRVAQDAPAEPFKKPANADLCAAFAEHLALDSFVKVEEAEASELKDKYGFKEPIAARRVQNAGQDPIGAGAQMCATAGGGAHPGPVCVSVFAGAYGKYDRDDFNSMLRHESFHCSHLLENAQKDGFWRKVITAAKAWDEEERLLVDLYTPMTEILAWLSYLHDPKASYFFLQDYRVFSVLDAYLRTAEKLIAGLRARPAKGQGFGLNDGAARKALADACQVRAYGVCVKARSLFPELATLPVTSMDHVRMVPYPG